MTDRGEGVMADYDYDVAVSFAGEDRTFVDDVVRLVKEAGLAVFYDEDAKTEMWGQDLTEYFPDIYENRARYTVMFVSSHYAAKPWTRLERRSVLLRAMQSQEPYLLPVRLDSTELPGVRASVAYLKGFREGPAGIATAVIRKVGSSHSAGTRRFNGRVPRTPRESAILIGERPAGWEYLFFSYCLARGVDERRQAWTDHSLQFALGGDFIATADLARYAQVELARVSSIAEVFDRLLCGPAQEAAMGASGEDGDPELIQHLADRMMSIYDELLRWAYRIRSATTPLDEGRALLLTLSDYATQPIEALRKFVVDFRDQMDRVTEAVSNGQDTHLEITIKFTIPDDVSARHGAALERFKAALN